MARLPQPGGDSGNWGDILNEYLSQSHGTDGKLKSNSVGTAQLQDNSVTAAAIAPDAVTKSDVGLGSVDNTADTAKPISTSQQSALDLKADTSALAAKLNTTDLDTQTAAKINDDASETAGALSATIAIYSEPRYKKIGTPRLCLVLDDTYADHAALAIPAVEARGGHCTLAVYTAGINVAGRMNSAEVIDAHQRGHQIAAHGVNHVDMAAASDATRLTEWGAKATLETLIGSPISTWVYPQSSTNTITGQQAWLRFGRTLTGILGQYVWDYGQGAHAMGRFSWANANHDAALDLIDTIAESGQTAIMYTHRTDGGGLSNGITYAQLIELLDKCTALGVELTTVDEAFGNIGADTRDFGFEEAGLPKWTPTLGGGVIERLADTAAANFVGAYSMHINRTSNGATYATSAIAIPCGGSLAVTLSGRLRYLNKTVGTGGAELALYEYDSSGTQVALNMSTRDLATVATWAQRTVAVTTNPATKFVRAAVRLVNADGDLYADHLHFDLTANGVRG